MEGVKEFLAIYSFKNEDIELAVNDVIEAATNGNQSHMDRPGWVRGRNRRTGIEGYFPGMFTFLFQPGIRYH